jgi:hypothetical protein
MCFLLGTNIAIACFEKRQRWIMSRNVIATYICFCYLFLDFFQEQTGDICLTLSTVSVTIFIFSFECLSYLITQSSLESQYIRIKYS